MIIEKAMPAPAKTGRPRKGREKNRKMYISIRVSESERALLAAAAKAENKTRSDFVLGLALAKADRILNRTKYD